MLKQFIATMTVVSAVMLIILFFTTTPSSTGPLGILGFFVLMYLAALGVLTFLFNFFNLFASRVLPRKYTRFGMTSVSLQKSYYYASVLALVPVMLVAMQSVGQIGIYQILLVVFFIIVAWVYVMNRTS